MQGRGCQSRRTISFGRESGCQLTGFGRETQTVPPNGGISWAQVHRNRIRASMAVSSGSGAAVVTTPEGGSPTSPSSSEDVNPSPDAAIDILSTDGAPNEMLGAPWDGPAKSSGNQTAFAA